MKNDRPLLIARLRHSENRFGTHFICRWTVCTLPIILQLLIAVALSLGSSRAARTWKSAAPFDLLGLTTLSTLFRSVARSMPLSVIIWLQSPSIFPILIATTVMPEPYSVAYIDSDTFTTVHGNSYGTYQAGVSTTSEDCSWCESRSAGDLCYIVRTSSLTVVVTAGTDGYGPVHSYVS